MAVALFVGGLELLQVLAKQLNLTGGAWNYIGDFNLNSAGYIIVATFAVVWIVALALWRYGKIEERWHDMAHLSQLKRGEDSDHTKAGMEPGPIREVMAFD